MISLLFNNTPCPPKHKSTIGLLYNKCMLCISCHFDHYIQLTLPMDHAKLLDVLMSLPVSHAKLPCAVYFAMSRPENHATSSYISGSGFESEPIRRCLFIDYISVSQTHIVFLRIESNKGGGEVAFCRGVNTQKVLS